MVMPTLHIPSAMRSVTGGAAKVTVPGDTLAEAVDALEAVHPGMRARLVEDGKVRGGLALFVDDEMVRSGLRTRLAPDSEVYFAPAVAGGI